MVKNAPPEKRGKWERQIEFFLSLLGYSVGIGSLVRFPYLCFNNGGGAFVIPFFLSYLLCGIPLFILELLLGQFSGLSPTTLWNFCPLFKGIGVSMACISGVVSIYYQMLIGYCIFYLVASFNDPVPWQTCGNWWNTDKCWDGQNTSIPVNATSEDFVWASDEYWHRRVLGISSSVEDVGMVRWELALCLLIGWLITFTCLAWGVKWTGKVVYVTAILPYVCLSALVIRGCTLEGASMGLYRYINPDFSKLLVPNTWIQGFLQMFYSLGPAWGGLITLSSYNNFRHNSNREGHIIPLLDMATAVFSGVAVFSILGSMATHSGLSIDKVAQTGPGLTFIAYPLALGSLPASQLWSAVFFLTVINLGLDSQFGMFETVLSGLSDAWPILRRHHTAFVGVMSALFYVAGLIFCTAGGNYYYQLLDWYGATFTVPLVAFSEVVAVALIYGLDNFSEDIRFMIGKHPMKLLKVSWIIAIPTTFSVFIFGIIVLAPPTYGSYKYPGYMHYIGILCISLSTALPLPITAIFVFFKTKPDDYPSHLPNRWVNRAWFHLITRLRNATIPNENWKPQEQSLHAEYKQIFKRRLAKRIQTDSNADLVSPSQRFINSS